MLRQSGMLGDILEGREGCTDVGKRWIHMVDHLREKEHSRLSEESS